MNHPELKHTKLSFFWVTETKWIEQFRLSWTNGNPFRQLCQSVSWCTVYMNRLLSWLLTNRGFSLLCQYRRGVCPVSFDAAFVLLQLHTKKKQFIVQVVVFKHNYRYLWECWWAVWATWTDKHTQYYQHYKHIQHIHSLGVWLTMTETLTGNMRNLHRKCKCDLLWVFFRTKVDTIYQADRYTCSLLVMPQLSVLLCAQLLFLL